ncbi:hypothetical protein HYS00_02810 [Candidatus Microgenomates bacterium]|nr:hypothetical protein [Candidatus Microgenomates bacterium]
MTETNSSPEFVLVSPEEMAHYSEQYLEGISAHVDGAALDDQALLKAQNTNLPPRVRVIENVPIGGMFYTVKLSVEDHAESRELTDDVRLQRLGVIDVFKGPLKVPKVKPYASSLCQLRVSLDKVVRSSGEADITGSLSYLPFPQDGEEMSQLREPHMAASVANILAIEQSPIASFLVPPPPPLHVAR